MTLITKNDGENNTIITNKKTTLSPIQSKTERNKKSGCSHNVCTMYF